MKEEEKTSKPEKDEVFNSAIEIDINDLEGEFLRQPSLTWHYGELEIRAMEVFEEAKADLDVLKAKLSEEKRKQYELSGHKIAKTTIESLVEMDQRVIDAEQTLREARRVKRLASLRFQAASKDRMSVLISVAANHRAQGNAEPYLRDNSFHGKSAPRVRVDEARIGPHGFGKKTH